MIALSLYIGSNIAIVLANTYSAPLGFRVLQALAIPGMLYILTIGSLQTLSGTLSVAYGVVTDVASPTEKGSFVSTVSFAKIGMDTQSRESEAYVQKYNDCTKHRSHTRRSELCCRLHADILVHTILGRM